MHFFARWLAAWLLPAGLAILLVELCEIVLDPLSGRTREHVHIGILVAYLALSALAHGLAMRGFLPRPTLWGIVTVAAVLVGYAATLTAARFTGTLWLPLLVRIAAWFAADPSLPGFPTIFIAFLAVGLLFGLACGSIQVIVLRVGWWPRLQWVAVSAGSGLLVAALAYAIKEAEAVDHGMRALVRVLNLPPEWADLVVTLVYATLLVACFALPTGVVLFRLLRHHREVADETLLRHFD